ncbi:hypothetical protein [Myroides marinus]|uniref:hypothetical protein n=1 Tax=Myroides marinus TaxID=703342 RepID=UPI002575F75B|nr:hypothetical protein [Myroides marinus]MDM1346030.1 hypothetical protein [Myroides marinus]MDM1353284.1 hypothetical protein [Myroides marinus]
MDTVMYYFYYLSSHFESFSPVVRITVFLTMVLGGVYIFSLLKIGAVAYKTQLDRHRYSKVKEKYEEPLSQLLQSKEDISSTQVLSFLGLENNELKNWEKACITDLLVNIIRKEYGVQ